MMFVILCLNSVVREFLKSTFYVFIFVKSKLKHVLVDSFFQDYVIEISLGNDIAILAYVMQVLTYRYLRQL